MCVCVHLGEGQLPLDYPTPLPLSLSRHIQTPPFSFSTRSPPCSTARCTSLCYAPISRVYARLTCLAFRCAGGVRAKKEKQRKKGSAHGDALLHLPFRFVSPPLCVGASPSSLFHVPSLLPCSSVHVCVCVCDRSTACVTALSRFDFPLSPLCALLPAPCAHNSVLHILVLFSFAALTTGHRHA